MAVYAFNRSTASNSDYIVYNVFLDTMPANFNQSSSFGTVAEAIAYVNTLLPPGLLGAPVRADLSALSSVPYTTGQLFNLVDYPVVNEGQSLQNSTVYSMVSFGGVSASASSAQLRVAVDNTQYQNCPAYVGYSLTINGPSESGQVIYLVFPQSLLTNGQIDSTNITTSNRMGNYVITYDFNTTTNTYTVRVQFASFTFNSNAIASIARLDGVQLEPYVVNTDPYTGAGYPASAAPGGYSAGSFDFAEDGITGVHTPGLDLLNCGLITAWRPSKAILAQLASWLWVTNPSQVLQQLFGNPINAIIGLHIVPVSPPVDGGTNTIKFGVEDSQVPCPKITSQHVTVDCGSITIEPKYGSYMDYAPQTSAELFLPYVGGLPLDVNDVIGKTIAVKYQIDVLSGACVAYVFIDGVLHYQKAGGCAATAPITGSQMPNVISGVLSIVGSVAGAVATMGASGAGTAAKVASGIATGTSVAESAANMLKQSISYAGTISGWAGLLGAQKPYLILSVPHAAIPGGQNTLMGYPAWVSGRVGDFTGYTECTVDRVTATRATDQEVEEIKALLAGGVIL